MISFFLLYDNKHTICGWAVFINIITLETFAVIIIHQILFLKYCKYHLQLRAYFEILQDTISNEFVLNRILNESQNEIRKKLLRLKLNRVLPCSQTIE